MEHVVTDDYVIIQENVVNDKELVLNLLKKHKVNTRVVEKQDIQVKDIIPTLRSAKINVPEAFFKDLSETLNMPFLDFAQVHKIYSNDHNSQLLSILPYPVITKYEIIPLEINQDMVKLAVSNPLDPRVTMVLKLLVGNRTVHLHVASSRAIEWAIENLYSKIHKQEAMFDLFNRTPDQSAYKVLYPNQKYLILAMTAVVVICMLLNSTITFIALFGIANIVYFIVNPIKTYISLEGFRKSRQVRKITKGELVWVFDEDLPPYTILIPIFHEASVLPQLLKNLYNLDYPKEKLDIKILMEEKDQETIGEAKKLGLFGTPQEIIDGISPEEYLDFLKVVDPIIIPKAEVTTKPRACNYGLLRAKGELCVIYDAEDDPDPDQLRKAAMVFLRSDEDVVCLQSKLNFYNSGENLLTKWFSIEYGYWYEFYLCGLDYFDAPIPLGGTSNHFRINKLNELGRWDPYNVTEDADIGIRISRQEFKTEVIDTYTFEEATLNVKSWIRQRSRWYKGHVQTYLVHMRNPKKLNHDLGAKQFWKFQLTFGAGIFMPLINPALWVILAVSIVAPYLVSGLVPDFLMPICIFNLTIGNLTYMFMYIVACVRLKKTRLIPASLLMPFYWALISVASWRGIIQLVHKPFYWDKTSHGVSKIAKDKNSALK